MLEHWPSGGRDTTEFPLFEIYVGDDVRKHLDAFCRLEGVAWGDYAEQQRVAGLDIEPQRYRSYRKMYQNMGLIYREDGRIRLSRFGRALCGLRPKLETYRDQAYRKISRRAVEILSRYQLLNPTESQKDELQEDCDVLPCICIWKAMLELDNKLHYEEMNRVMLRIMKMDELDETIAKIRTARNNILPYSEQDEQTLIQYLGEEVHSNQPSARIAYWFSFVGWGGLLIERSSDSEGFRNLVIDMTPIMREAVAKPPSFFRTDDEEEWFLYYIGDSERSIVSWQEETSLSDAVYADWERDIERKGQVIFYGPPGTGKTYIAEKFALGLIEGGDGFTESLQFHPSYAYEDFVEGIRPEVDDEGRLTYPLVPGRFLEFCERASARTDRCVLVIDEINRADLSRVFGELMYLLEYRNKEIPLANGKMFHIPDNVRIVGTMNTADRSIALVDHALRRRFAFIALYPDYDILRKYHEGTDFPVEELVTILKSLNQKIGDKNYHIGITYFLRENIGDEMRGIWVTEIEPYLEEYFFNQLDVIEEFRWDIVKGRLSYGESI